MKLIPLPASALLAVAAATPMTAPGQDARAPFEASWVAFPNDTSIVATGDFDADGAVDAIGWYWTNTNYNQATLRTYRNDGRGNFARVTQRSVNIRRNETWDVRVGKLDDVAGDDWVAAFVSEVLTSTGPGWTEPAPVIQLRLLDFDGDGRDDLAILNATQLRVYRNMGAAGFALTALHPVSGAVELHTARLDGDSISDLVCAGPAGVAMVYVRADGSTVAGSTFPLAILPNEAVMFAAGDIDGDGDDDVVAFVDKAGGIPGNAEYVTLRQTAPGTFATEARVPGGPATGLADIDGDGDLDGTCCGGGGPSPARNSGRSVFHMSLNDGSGKFAKAWTIVGLGAFRFAGAVDVDGDGDRDLIAGRAVFFNQSNFAVDPQPDGASVESQRVAYDHDGDGDPDCGLSWSSHLENDGTGALRPVIAMRSGPPTGYLTGNPFAGDFDGDGDIDLIARHGDSSGFLGMRMLWNNGGGGYVDGGPAAAAGVSFSNSTTPQDNNSQGLAADIDGDGDQDLIVGNTLGFIAFRVWANDGAGYFTLRQMTFGGLPRAVLDVDHDNVPDLITTDSVHYGAGDGTLGGRSLTNIRGPAGIGDLNGDGYVDIAWGDHFGSEVTLLWNRGNRTFSELTVTTPVPLSNSSSDTLRTAIVDADGDGHGDILVGPTLWYEGDNTLVLYGDGTLNFARYTMMSFDLGEMADVDGDGDLDVLGPDTVRSARALVPRDGLRRQYGFGVAGLGGMIPQLGAVGPFHAGGVIELRMSGARGGALGVFVLGLQRVDLADWPLPGLHGFAAPAGVLPIVVGGTPGAAGEGTMRLPVAVPAALSGVHVFHQAFFVDAAAPAGVTHTCGLELRYR